MRSSHAVTHPYQITRYFSQTPRAGNPKLTIGAVVAAIMTPYPFSFRIALTAIAAAASLAAPAAMANPFGTPGGKLLLTNGVSTVEGTSGGGLAPWATIAGNATDAGIGLSAHATIVELKDYDFQAAGISVGLWDRVELSYTRQNFNTNDIGALLGLGKDYAFNQDVFGAKVRLFGDLVYDNPLVPAVAIGAQYKRNRNGTIVRAIGAKDDDGIDYYATATKLFLSHSVLVNATVRATKANQLGILGFSGDRNDSYKLQFEGSVAYQLSRRFVIGGEYRMKPNNLGIAKEDDWFDAFAAYAINRNLTATMAYVDLGSIATVPKQRGVFFQLQASF